MSKRSAMYEAGYRLAKGLIEADDRKGLKDALREMYEHEEIFDGMASAMYDSAHGEEWEF